MNFNLSKCNFLRIFPSKQKKVFQTTYFLHGQQLEVADSSKYLGVTITDDLSRTNHIETIAAKGNRTVVFLRRNFRDCTTKVKSATYTTMVCPTLEYASTAWDPYKQKDAHLLEKVCLQETGHRVSSNHCSTVWSGTALKC